MNEVLSATWAAMYIPGVLTQLMSPIRFSTKNSNQYGAFVSFMLLLCSIPVGFAAFGPLLGAAIAATSIYLLLNAWVLALWRFHALRTRAQVVRTAIMMNFLLALFVIAESVGFVTQLNVAMISLTLSCMAVAKVGYLIRKGQMRTHAKHEGKLPTVSLAVPARNETHALTQHLKSTLKSDYPKLEFIVADDCSQDDTAQIIRSFAHDGVRFVQGITPTDSWIGKNRAYDLLYEESSGEYIVFTGVDTRYEPETVSRLVGYMKHHKLDMVSVMPQHEKLTTWSMLIQPVRYFIMLLTASDVHPPVLSTTWVIKRSKLKKYGGFAAFENSIVPEQHFAKRANAEGKYRFIVAPPELGLTTFKKPSSQQETAIRYLYPRLRKTLSNHALFTLVASLMFAYPIGYVVYSVLTEWTLVSTLYAVAIITVFIAYSRIIKASYGGTSVVLGLPYFLGGFISMYVLSLRSMIGYELDTVIWKGRSVCYPVMMSSLNKDN